MPQEERASFVEFHSVDVESNDRTLPWNPALRVVFLLYTLNISANSSTNGFGRIPLQKTLMDIHTVVYLDSFCLYPWILETTDHMRYRQLYLYHRFVEHCGRLRLHFYFYRTQQLNRVWCAPYRSPSPTRYTGGPICSSAVPDYAATYSHTGRGQYSANLCHIKTIEVLHLPNISINFIFIFF